MAEVTDFSDRLSDLVTDHCRTHGLSRAAFAELIKVGDSTLKSYMLGVTEPRVTEITRICKLTGSDIRWLVYGTPATETEWFDPAALAEPRHISLSSLVPFASVLEAINAEIAKSGTPLTSAKRAALIAGVMHLVAEALS
jgi:transcriptional regulator with XRE-family HTH domain